MTDSSARRERRPLAQFSSAFREAAALTASEAISDSTSERLSRTVGVSVSETVESYIS